MTDAYYIDTRPGAGGVFAPMRRLDHYGDWLKLRYEKSQDRVGESVQCWGVSQRINSLIQSAVRHNTKVFAIGPHAGAAASFVEKVSNRTIEVEVLS